MWLTFSQTTEDVICGFEAAWEFFGGVFLIVIPDNMSPIVDQANPLEPRLNQAFVEYAQARGFLVDAARVRHPQDKPRVERTVTYVRRSFFSRRALHRLRRRSAPCKALVQFDSGASHPRDHAMPASRALRHRREARSSPCSDKAIRPAALPEAEGPQGPSHRGGEGALLGAGQPDRPLRRRPGRSRAREDLLSGPGGEDPSETAAGGHSTDREDLPAGKSIYALRDLDRLKEMAASHGVAIGGYAAVLLDNPLPWTKMRQVYALLGLVKKWGPERGRVGV